jgi:ABC-type dipeptide/oligopeptide/nickel transport system permease subunit
MSTRRLDGPSYVRVAPVQVLPVTPPRARSLLGDAVRRFRRDRLAVTGLVVAVIFVILGIVGPLIAPYDYLAQDLNSPAIAPTAAHWLGTDNLGRDMLSRILWGFQTALAATVVVTGLSVGIGILMGGVAGEIGGAVDQTLTWMTNLVMTIPVLLLAVLVDYTVREPLGNLTEQLYQTTHWNAFSTGIYSDYIVLFASLSLVFWPHFARLIRGQVLSIRESDYVVAARAIGVPLRVLLTRYLVPNALGPILVVAALDAADIIVLEASLSYLGVGIHPPGASWGSMIQENLSLWSFRPHLVIIPAVVLGVTALGIAFVGNGLADALDPRGAGRRL